MIESMLRSASEARNADTIITLHDFAMSRGLKLPSLGRFQRVGFVYAMLQAPPPCPPPLHSLGRFHDHSLSQVNRPVAAFDVAVQCFADGLNFPHSAYNLLAKTLASHVSLVDDAYYLLETRHNNEQPVPLAAINLIIDACALVDDFGDLDRAFATWAELDRLKLEPDVSTYNALLHTCVRSREASSGRRLLAQMAASDLKPNEYTYQFRVALLAMQRQEYSALDAYKECRAADLMPTEKTYVTLINCALRCRRYAMAREICDEFEAHVGPRAGIRSRVEDAVANYVADGGDPDSAGYDGERDRSFSRRRGGRGADS